MTSDKPPELVQKAREQRQQRQEEQEDFLEAVAKEEGIEPLETTVTLVGDYTVTVTARLDGQLMDRLAHIDEKLDRVEAGDERVYKASEAADDAAQLLADLVDDPEYNKELFYRTYEQQGLDIIGDFIETIFEGLQNARERRQGTADGFRQE